MRKNVWYQIDGDVNVAEYGGTLARWDGYSVEFYRITPVLEAVGRREAQCVGFPFWGCSAVLDCNEAQPTLESVSSMMNDELGWSTLHFEPMTAGWSKDVLRPLGGTVSGHEWWRAQGHGFRSADREFREILMD